MLAGALLVAAGLLWNRAGRVDGPAPISAPDWGRTADPRPPATGSPTRPPGRSATGRSATGRSAPGAVPVPSGTELRIDRLSVRATVRPVTVTAGVLGVPQDPAMLGWWSAGARPGDRTGSVVVDGHVNYAGVRGALSVLPLLRPGEPVSLLMDGSRYRYTVTAARTYPKTTGLPAQLFSRTGPAQLVLITCGGPFDSGTGNYRDNIVAYAVPSGT